MNTTRKRKCFCNLCKGRKSPISAKVIRRHFEHFGVCASDSNVKLDLESSSCSNSTSSEDSSSYSEDLCSSTVCADSSKLGKTQDRNTYKFDLEDHDQLQLNSAISESIPESERLSSLEDDRDREDVIDHDLVKDHKVLALPVSDSDHETSTIEDGDCEDNLSSSIDSCSSSSRDDTTSDEESDYDCDKELLSSCRSSVPLYNGSSETVLETLAGYFHWFSSHPSVSKTAVSDLLKYEQECVLPTENNLLSNYHDALKFIKPFLLPSICYHACPNDCVLFRKTNRYDYSSLDKCPKCRVSRYTANKQPLRRFVYYPVGPRLKRLFKNNRLSCLLKEHHQRKMGIMMDIHDSPQWKDKFSDEGPFNGDPRCVLLQLSTDGVNPFSVNRVNYSMWPIMVTVLNFPKSFRNSFENIMLVGIIPANNKGEPKNVDPYLEVVVDELLAISGSEFYDGDSNEVFKLQVHIQDFVMDYPGFNKVFCCTGPGAKQGCMWCELCGKWYFSLSNYYDCV